MNRILRTIGSGIGLLLALGLGLALGWLTWGGARGGAPVGSQSSGAATEAAATIWTCSMHPQIHMPAAGQCPICGMDLIPLVAGAVQEGGERRLVVSASDRARMQIEVVPVERRFATAEIRMAGKVAYDESRLASITAWVPGRIDHLFVDYTGLRVEQGDHMVSLYSPELYSAQQELLQAKKTAADLARSDIEALRVTSAGTLEAARTKLRLLGLADEQIAEIEQRGSASEHMTIYAPVGGVVVQKDAREGMYVTTGTRIFAIADLSRLWVILDAYESDLTWLRYGQHVQFQTQALAGTSFAGTVSFIDPVLDAKTRTVKVRVIVDNADGRLKPEMFVDAVVRARVAAHGQVMDASLLGKWISPMHPEVVKDGPGQCDVCGMDLVPAEQLGYVAVNEAESEKPLLIPVTAALVTGKRAIVYVEVPDAEVPTYEGREVVLGPRAGDVYIIKSGLEEGERVVRSGAFKIDSALQIQARPSMMSLGGDQRAAHEEADVAESKPFRLPEATRVAIGAAWKHYSAVQAALARDDFAAALGVSRELARAWAGAEGQALDEPMRDEWLELALRVRATAQAAGAAADIDELRAAFEKLSKAFIEVARRAGVPEVERLFVVHCPMAFGGRGADWLQAIEDVTNPYYGDAMLSCGAVTEEIAGQQPEDHDHDR